MSVESRLEFKENTRDSIKRHDSFKMNQLSSQCSRAASEIWRKVNELDEKIANAPWFRKCSKELHHKHLLIHYADLLDAGAVAFEELEIAADKEDDSDINKARKICDSYGYVLVPKEDYQVMKYFAVRR